MKSCPNHGPLDAPGLCCPACGEEFEYSPDYFDLAEPTVLTKAMLFSRPTVVRDLADRERIQRYLDSHVAGLDARRAQARGDERKTRELTLLIDQALDFRGAFLGVARSPSPT